MEKLLQVGSGLEENLHGVLIGGNAETEREGMVHHQ